MTSFLSASSVGEKVLSATTPLLQVNENESKTAKRKPATTTKNGINSNSSTQKSNDGIGDIGKGTGHVNPSWGRFNAGTWMNTLGCGGIILICPILVILLEVGLFRTEFHGSIVKVLLSIYELGPIEFSKTYGPQYCQTATIGYFAWVIFQIVLYMGLPSKICYGQQTPAGHLLPYHVNGLSAWIVSHVAWAVGSYIGLIDPALIARNWPGLIVAFNIYGYILPLFAYIKAHLAPTHTDDRKFSGSIIYDYYMGIEFNPRIGKWFDFKLFHNGRPGIVMWTLM
jgi:7-dehydrocholesterol reductase